MWPYLDDVVYCEGCGERVDVDETFGGLCSDCNEQEERSDDDF